MDSIEHLAAEASTVLLERPSGALLVAVTPKPASTVAFLAALLVRLPPDTVVVGHHLARDGAAVAGTQLRPAARNCPLRPLPLDMGGNIFEWCADWFDALYPAVAPDSNPRGPAGGVEKAARGPAWWVKYPDRLPSRRWHYSPESRAPDLGFRGVGVVKRSG